MAGLTPTGGSHDGDTPTGGSPGGSGPSGSPGGSGPSGSGPSGSPGGSGPSGGSRGGGASDVGAFLARLVRLDAEALVRVRPAGTPDRRELWARVPWDVLVTRTVEWSGADPAGTLDVTVSAAAWLSAVEGGLAGLPRLDARWRTPLPAGSGAVVVLETIPTSVVRGIGAAAAATLRATSERGVGGRAVGERAIRDALLDHVPIVVIAGDDRVDVPQRVVQAVARMGFLGKDSDITQVLRNGPWIGISASYGIAWWRRESALRVHRNRG